MEEQTDNDLHDNFYDEDQCNDQQEANNIQNDTCHAGDYNEFNKNGSRNNEDVHNNNGSGNNEDTNNNEDMRDNNGFGTHVDAFNNHSHCDSTFNNNGSENYFASQHGSEPMSLSKHSLFYSDD